MTRISAGRKEFKGNKTKLTDITPKKWAILQGLAYVLTGFERGTKILSGKKYPTFVAALPVLRFIKNCISNDNMFIYTNRDTLSQRQNSSWILMEKNLFLRI